MKLLLLHALGRTPHDRAWLLAHDSDALDADAHICFDAALQRRLAGEPVAYITGRKDFFGLTLSVDARVLDPRPDTETLVEWALAVLPAAPAGPLILTLALLMLMLVLILILRRRPMFLIALMGFGMMDFSLPVSPPKRVPLTRCVVTCCCAAATLAASAAAPSWLEMAWTKRSWLRGE